MVSLINARALEHVLHMFYRLYLLLCRLTQKFIAFLEMRSIIAELCHPKMLVT